MHSRNQSVHSVSWEAGGFLQQKIQETDKIYFKRGIETHQMVGRTGGAVAFFPNGRITLCRLNDKGILQL